MGPDRLRAFLLASLGLASCAPTWPSVPIETSVCEVDASHVASCQPTTAMVPENETTVCTQPDATCLQTNTCPKQRCKAPPQLEGACATSLDCRDGKRCLLDEGEDEGVCVAAQCSGTCAAGLSCSAYFLASADGSIAEHPSALTCLPADGRTAADVTGKWLDRCTPQRLQCSRDEGRWTCRDVTPAKSAEDLMHPCGRALVVEGRARHARGVELTPEERRDAIIRRFTRIALDEHASVAAFGRTILALLALGAPAWLIERTSEALRDEVEHAKLAFGLLSTLRGDGALRWAGQLPEAVAPMASDLAGDLLADVLSGGCVGESLAVLEAAELSLEAPAETHAFLERVVVDEARHAALAFETARWLLASFPELRPAAQRLWREAIAPVDARLRAELFEPVAIAAGLAS